jgi:hypothetical protein
MLSRVAENLYWLARYIERAENTARLVNVNANLVLDLPKGMSPGWQPLVDITGGEECLRQSYKDSTSERRGAVLIADTGNPGSILSSLLSARENARTVRDVMPREVWEQVNDLYLYAKGNLARLSQARPLRLPARIIARCPADHRHARRHHEPTTRLRLPAHRPQPGARRHDHPHHRRALGQPAAGPEPELTPFENIQWMSVLKSLSAYQMYRRHMQVRVRRPQVLKFLLREALVPALEALAAVLEHRRIVGEEQLEVVGPGRAVELAVVVRVVAADLRAGRVDAAAAVRLEEAAAVVDQQEPAVLVLVYLGIMVGQLPQQRIEVLDRARGVDLLGQVGAAGGVGAESALVLGGDLHLADGLDGDDGGHGGSTGLVEGGVRVRETRIIPSPRRLDEPAWDGKCITLLGMSGVGKTVLAHRLREPPLVPLLRRLPHRHALPGRADPGQHQAPGHAGAVPARAAALRLDLHPQQHHGRQPEPVSSFLGKLGNPERAGLGLAEFKHRQALHREAEIAAMRDVPEFIRKAREIYGYRHFVNDAGGSVCELDDPEVLRVLAEHTLILYIKATGHDERELIQRAEEDPKPLYYRAAFLDEQLDAYLKERGLRRGQIEPDDFVRWMFPRLFRSRIPRYEAIAAEHGYTVTTEELAAVRDEAGFLSLIEAVAAAEVTDTPRPDVRHRNRPPCRWSPAASCRPSSACAARARRWCRPTSPCTRTSASCTSACST